MPSTVKTQRPRSEEHRREFVRRFVESVPSGELEVTSTPFRRIETFILPLGGIESGNPRQLGVGIYLTETPRFGILTEIFGKVVLVKDREVITSRSLRLRLLRLDKPTIYRWEAYKILSEPDGPKVKPVAWRVKVSRPADFGHVEQGEQARSVAIEATGTWLHKAWIETTKEYTVRLSLVIEAEPDPRAYLTVSIDDSARNIWTAHSRWVSFAGIGFARYVEDALEGKHGEARDQP